MKNYIKYYIVFFGLILLFYYPLYRGFFQQDEWMGFDTLYTNGIYNVGGAFKNYFVLNIGHYVPMHQVLFHLMFLVFGLNYQGWVTVSLVWHGINACMVFLLARKILKNNQGALLVVVLFVLSAASYQATAWVGADINTHGSTLFTLLSMYFFWGELEEKKPGKGSLVFLVISLLFKETAVGLFGLYPALILFKKGIKRVVSRDVLLWAVAGGGYVMFRGLGLVLPIAYEGAQLATETQSLNLIVYNMISLPGKVFVQVLVTPDGIMKLGLEITKIAVKEKLLSPVFLLVTQIRDRAVFVEGFYFVAIISGMWVALKRKSKAMIWGLGLVIFTTPIFGLSPERTGIFRYVDSRNMYLAAAGVFVFLVDLIWEWDRWIKWGLVLSLVIMNCYFLEKNLGSLARDGAVRKEILIQMMSDTPVLSEKTVFYTESDTSYYVSDKNELLMPFLSGFGQTLMVWYQNENDLPGEFFKNRFLWEIESQGYKEVNDRGFGYYRDFGLLKNAIDEYNVPVESVIAYSWMGWDKKLTNITDEVRKRIEESEEN